MLPIRPLRPPLAWSAEALAAVAIAAVASVAACSGPVAPPTGCFSSADCAPGLLCTSGQCTAPDAGSDAGTDAGHDAGPDAGPDAGHDAGTDAGTDAGQLPYVFVIVMENQDGTNALGAGVYGNSSAPYINGTLKARYASASSYGDNLGPLVPSEPHYLWMEAGTNAFGDKTFTGDGDPSQGNSTSDTDHLVTQLKAAANGKTWRAYQEGLSSATGACPITSSGYYAAKHDPFVFFQDVAGSPPSATNAECAAHHRAFTAAAFQADLTAGDVAAYTFITPNLCNDMHGASGCPNGCTSGFTSGACIAGGDAFLRDNVPAILAFVQAHGGALFIVWDEPALNTTTPFLVVGPHVKPGYVSPFRYSHSSLLKSLQEVLGLPVSVRVAPANDFEDFFESGAFP